MANKEYLVNISMPGYKAGQKVNVEVDAAGVAVNQFWRRRIRDAKIDNCIEEVQEVKQDKKTSLKSNSEA